MDCVDAGGSAETCCTAASDTVSLKDDILWGVKAISEEIGRTERQAFYLLETGQLPAKKTGGRWWSTRTALRGFFNPLVSGVAA
jgi:hypothetical protein